MKGMDGSKRQGLNHQ